MLELFSTSSNSAAIAEAQRALESHGSIPWNVLRLSQGVMLGMKFQNEVSLIRRRLLV
jgi:hypothetical protein